MLILHAQIPSTNHQFIELFTTNEKLEDFLKSHPEVEKLQVTYHEIDPK